MIDRKIISNWAKYAMFAVNSLLFALAVIMFQRFYFSADGIDSALFDFKRLFIFIGIAVCAFFTFFICTLGEKRKKYELLIEKIGAHPLSLVLTSSAVFRVWYISFSEKFIIYYDSKTYTDYPINIFKGETDIFRTPGYPYFLKFIHFITGISENNEEFYAWVVIIQSLLSFSSIILLYFAGRCFFKNRYILCLATFVYGICPFVFSWDSCILTESLSMFCAVLLIYLVCFYLSKPKLYKAIILGLYTFVLVMVRPTFIYALAIIAVFFIARFIFTKAERKNCIAGFLSVLISISFVLGYCGLNYKNHKYFAISSVNNTVNNLYIVMQNGWTDNKDYPEISEHLETEMENSEQSTWIPTIVEVMPKYFSYEEIDSYVVDCISKNKADFYDYTFAKVGSQIHLPVAVQYTHITEDADARFKSYLLGKPIYRICDLLNKDIYIYGSADNSQPVFESVAQGIMTFTFPYSYADCFWLVVIGVAFALTVLVTKKRICWQVIGLCAIIFSHMFVSFYGSMAEFERLNAMIVPAVILLAFYYVDCIISSLKGFKFNDNNSTAIDIKNKANEESE